jgi:conjugal transfer mating pair stabilization protein TraN
MSSDGRNRCSPNQCVNLDTTPAVEDEDVDDEVLQDDGPRDAEGNCLGTVYIFRGKSMKCRPSGYKTGFTNCCNKSQGVISDSVTGITGISTIGALKAGYDIIKTGAIAAKIGAGELQIMTYSKDLVVITKGATGEVVHTLTKLQAQAFEGIPLSTGTVGIPGGADAAVNQVMSNWATNLGPQIALAAVTMAIQDPVLSSTVNLIGTALMGGGPIGIALAVVNLAMSIFTEKCTPQDIETSTLNDSKYCHYVGDYCESKWPLIGCVQRAKRFCCFNSKLARIIHEQGRPQLSAFSRGWGSAKSPNCRGFKPEEFQMLDFSKMDLSEYFRDIQKDINQKIQKVQSNATQKIQQFYQNTK